MTPKPSHHVFQLTGTFLMELNSHIKETNVLTKFHENWSKNVTSRVVKCPAHWRPYINKTNVLTNFHDDWAKTVTSSQKTAPPTGRHKTNVLTKFHDNWAKNKNAPPTGGHVFSPIWTIFELARDINKTNFLPNFYDDWAKIVASRVFTWKTVPPTGGHVFQRTATTFELNQHIIKANILTKFHENWAKKLKCPAHWRPYINKTNVLTNFHDDWAKIVTSGVFTRKTALTTGGHVFQHTGTIFELNQHIVEANILTKFELNRDIIGTNVLTEFHEDRTKNVASSVYEQMWTDRRRTKTGQKSSPEQSGELKSIAKTLNHAFSKLNSN
ncbi:hypothetical protein DPMN_178954 [Dreissena polymorpha]|uniref:Uncharacterized protein n=1 Tax=Dreissena polymorpha TaxID=45954 RepID=A0A9D4EBW8_DREPO|nr:hypothetical protein DPMN_178954 [Dreissena polymorpha]